MTVESFVERYRSALVDAQRSVDVELGRAAERGVTSGFGEVLRVVGSAAERIEEVRALWGYLPASVEAFLVVFGEDVGGVDLGVDCRTAAVLDAGAVHEEWMGEVAGMDWFDLERYAVPDGACFLGHHGGGYFLFVVDRVADPVVWSLMEGHTNQRLHEQSGVQPLGLTFGELVLASIGDVPVRVGESLSR